MQGPDAASKAYLAQKVNPILEQLVVQLVMKKPEKVVTKLIYNLIQKTKFMVEWLNQNGESIEKLSATKKSNDSEGSDDDEGEMIDLEQLKKQKATKVNRTSVSAEVYGQFNKKTDFKPKKVPKNEDAIHRIRTRLSQAFMFSQLDANEQQIVVDAMVEVKFNKGQNVIVQGADGDNLYVVDKGELDCYRKFTKDGPDQHLKIYKPGESFGELALLYNAPRAATIIAKTDCSLFSLDRSTFNHIVKDAAAKKREKYENFLGKVDIIHDMEPYERLQIADALKELKFKKGDFIVREGEAGETFYILEEGTAQATKTLKAGETPQQVFQYKSGEYFGEIALLKNTVRAANVQATSDAVVIALDRESFKRLLGPLDEILRRNFVKYEKYVS